MSLVGAFQHPSQYKEIFPVKDTGIKVLDQEFNSDGGINMNNISYIPASKQLFKDEKNLILSKPMVYIKSVAIGYYIYFLPSSNFSFIAQNRQRIDSFNRIFNTAIYGKIFGDEKINASLTMHSIFSLTWFVIGFYLFMTIFVLKESYGFFVKRKLKPEYITTLLFIYGTILYVMIIGNLFEIGENHRYRFITDPLFFVMVGIMLFFFFKRRKTALANKS